jgi:hypothetical protein
MVRYACAALVSAALISAISVGIPGGCGLGISPVRATTFPADQPSQGGPVTAVYLQGLLDKANYIEFAYQLPNVAHLKPEQEMYFKGTLAYRQGRFGEVVNPLIAAVQTRNSVLTPSQIENAFEILGQASAKTFLYGSSAKMYDDIDKLYGAKMGDGIRDIREKRHTAALLEGVPAETARIAGDFTLQSQAGEYPVTVSGKSFLAELDTGASISMLSESEARNWGVTLLEGEATLHGYGGGGFTARPGLIPVLQIGKAELHNVVVFVTADRNLYIDAIKRQKHALLGYPVASALGRLTFTRDGVLTVTAQAGSAGSGTGTETGIGARMWIGDGSLLVALGTVPVIEDGKLNGGTRERLFELDTGSGNTYLTDHYLAENRSRFTGEPESIARLAGAGGIHEIPAYKAHKLPLFFGATPVLCSGQHVLTQPQGGEAESYYGVVGQDILRLFSSYTVDFRNMRFSVVP